MRIFFMLSLLTMLSAPAMAQKGKSQKVEANRDGYAVVTSTNIDFSETMIDGQMKAPAGFFLQGRQAQSLSQMVKLRSNFRRELQGSGAGVKSLIK